MAMNRRDSSSVLTAGVVGAPLARWLTAAPIARSGDIAIVIEAGGNGVSSPEAIKQADARLHAMGYADVRWVVFPQWPSTRVQAARLETARNVRAANVRVIEVRVGASDVGPDGQHFSRAGGQRVADQILEAIGGLNTLPFADRPGPQAAGSVKFYGPSRSPAEPMPGSRRVHTLPSPDLARLFTEVGQRTGVPPLLLAGVAWVESAYRSSATSRVGAMGMMQIVPDTARSFGLQDLSKLRDPEVAVPLGARHLKRDFDRFGNWTLAAAAYNAGPGNVQRYAIRGGRGTEYRKEYTQPILAHILWMRRQS